MNLGLSVIFPAFAIMPGVLIVEALAQTASFSIYPYIADDIGSFARNFECIFGRRRSDSVPKNLSFPGMRSSFETESHGACAAKLLGFFVARLSSMAKRPAETDILVSLISHKLETSL